MKVLRIAALMVLVVSPVYAQMPNMNLIPEFTSKTPEEKEADAVREKAYRESLKKIPDAKVSNDPWGTVRTDPPKNAPAKAATAAKPRTKTGSAAN